jgi:hypothetical protein
MTKVLCLYLFLFVNNVVLLWKNKTKTQHRDTGNTGYTRRKTKLKHNTETPATLGTQEEKQN